MIGRTLSHYKVLEEISRGGMGIVYKALDVKLNREVALKVLPPELVSDPERKRRFLQEARAAAALKHPNIAHVYEIDEVEGVDFIAMELIEGEKLSDVVSAGPLSMEQALSIAFEFAEALAAAHAHGIVHRDLKPGNVMLTQDGHPKVIDFGLAKLEERPLERDSEAATVTRHETEAGKLLGTVAYMSPEQARGQKVGPRSDLFSFGIVLYQALTGVSPFGKGTVADTLSAILNEDPPPLSTFVHVTINAGVQEILDRCLCKSVDGRYADATQLVEALSAVGQQIEPVRPRTPTWRIGRAGLAWTLAASLGLAALIVVMVPRLGRHNVELEPAPPTALAVLQFQNLTNEKELDWLQTGIPELLVTDLAQSPELVVASTARVHDGLKAYQLADDVSLSLEDIRRLASEIRVGAVVRGSYARIGEQFRISFTVENTESGAILASDRVEGRGEDNLFGLMDEVSAAIRYSYEIGRPAASPPTVAASTTSSFEAWRLYTEALALSWEFKDTEAAVLLERAVEIDPSFALGLVALGGIHRDMGHAERSEEYLRQALALADHLPLDDRFQVEAVYYGSRWRTLGRAIDLFEQGLQLYPDNGAWRNNLARRYAFHERYEDALEQFDRLIKQGADFSGDYFDAANAHAALGQFEMGYRLVAGYTAKHPDEWFAHQGLGWFLTEWGRLDEAEKSFDAAEQRRPGDWSIPYARWRVAILREDFEKARGYTTDIAVAEEPLGDWRGAVSLARNALYGGKPREALELLNQAVTSYAEPNSYTALARCWKAELLLATGQPSMAIDEARLARREGADEWPEFQAVGIAAVVHRVLGEKPESDARLSELRGLWGQTGPRNRVEERYIEYVEGLVALAHDDTESARAHLLRAESLLPPKGVEFHWHVYPIHVPIWAALGNAEMKAGNLDDARSWFERVTSSGSEHLEQPVPYVRSFYQLGQINEMTGEMDKAREYYERFLNFWEDSEINVDWVEHAKSML